VSAAIVSGVNSAPVLEPAEHVFDLVALFVERPIVQYDNLSACPRWNAGRNPACSQGVSKPVGVTLAAASTYRLLVAILLPIFQAFI
jgi:hypothetical protein